MTTYPMSPVDAAWYHMDGPENLAMVTGVLLTRVPLDFAKVREVYRTRIVEFDRFCQRVVESGFPIATPQWQDMPHFDIDQHVHRVALPGPHDEAALKALITDIASSPLDHEQPLWQVHVVDDVAGGGALIMRYHHCIGDGTAMMAVIQRLFDTSPRVVHKKTAPAPAASPQRAASATLLPGLDAIERAARRALAMTGAAVDAVLHPQKALQNAALVLGGAGMLLTELVKSPDPQSPLKGKFGMRKHVAWSRPVAIADVKAIGAPAGAKVNDVLVAAMTGALRSYLKRRGIDVDHTTVRAMVPVDLRPPERVGKLGNEFGLVVLELAVASARASQRLAATKARMDALKRSPEPVAMRFLFDLFGRAPKAVEDLANYVFGTKTSVVMTNVAGPRETLYLAGVPIERMMFWVPHPGRQLGMGISILSYRGMASLSVIADAHLVPDPEKITDEFNRQFERMRRAAASRVDGRSAKKPLAAPKAPLKASRTRATPKTAGARAPRKKTLSPPTAAHKAAPKRSARALPR